VKRFARSANTFAMKPLSPYCIPFNTAESRGAEQPRMAP
jgi:hypothetical protein